MAKPGRKPKPTALRLLEGNPSRRPLNDMEPTCSLPPVKPPIVAADKIASFEWERLMASMPPSIYTALDSAPLAAYALAWSMLAKAQHEIDMNGLMVTVRNSSGALVEMRKNAAVSIWKTAAQTVIQLSDRLGLTPSVRSRLQVPQREDVPQSRFADLMGRRN